MGGLLRMFVWGLISIFVLVPLGFVLVLAFGLPIAVVAAVLGVPLLLVLLAVVGIPLILLVVCGIVLAVVLALFKVALFLILPIVVVGMIVSWILRGFAVRRPGLTTW
jgi:hypothetical protein